MKTKIKCTDCGKYLEKKMTRRINVSLIGLGIHCYKCGSMHIKLSGRYDTLERGIMQRWICCHCNYNFIKRTLSYRRKINKFIIKKILKYSLKHKGYFNKYDNSKKTTYSTRELAEIFNVSKSSICDLLKIKRLE